MITGFDLAIGSSTRHAGLAVRILLTMVIIGSFRIQPMVLGLNNVEFDDAKGTHIYWLDLQRL